MLVSQADDVDVAGLLWSAAGQSVLLRERRSHAGRVGHRGCEETDRVTESFPHSHHDGVAAPTPRAAALRGGWPSALWAALGYSRRSYPARWTPPANEPLRGGLVSNRPNERSSIEAPEPHWSLSESANGRLLKWTDAVPCNSMRMPLLEGRLPLGRMFRHNRNAACLLGHRSSPSTAVAACTLISRSSQARGRSLPMTSSSIRSAEIAFSGQLSLSGHEQAVRSKRHSVDDPNDSVARRRHLAAVLPVWC